MGACKGCLRRSAGRISLSRRGHNRLFTAQMKNCVWNGMRIEMGSLSTIGLMSEHVPGGSAQNAGNRLNRASGSGGEQQVVGGVRWMPRSSKAGYRTTLILQRSGTLQRTEH